MNSANLWRYFQLIDMQAKMKMKAQANKLVLSYLWWVLEPLLFVSLFYFVFEVLLQRGGPGFVTFLIVGKIIYLWFSKSVIMASTGLNQNKGIIGQRALPKWIFPLVNIQESTYKALISFLLLFVVLQFQGYSVYFGYWQLIPLLLLTYLLICGVGFICSLFVTMAQDFSNLIQLGMMGVMFGSGIFWDINQIADPVTRELIFTLNPVAALLDGFRQVLIYQNPVNFERYIPCLVVSVLLLIASLVAFKRFNNVITRVLFS